jgi:hypothetical protein
MIRRSAGIELAVSPSRCIRLDFREAAFDVYVRGINCL